MAARAPRSSLPNEPLTPDSACIFSVVVPFLNEERLLPACLSALEQQTLDPSRFELIFVDNGSTDRSREIVSNCADAILLREPQQDPYLARNHGIAAAKSRYIAFLDADCIPDRDWLEALWTEIQQSDAAIVIGYIAYPSSASLFVRCYEEYYDYKLKHLTRRKLAENFFGHAGNMVVRADVFDELGPFLPMPVVGDTEIIHRLLAYNPGAVIRYAERARVIHGEVETLRGCLAKLYECGGYTETLSRISSYRAIPLIEKWRIAAGCLRERKYGPRSVIALLFTLALGWLTYLGGRIKRFLQSWRTPRASRTPVVPGRKHGEQP